MSAVRALKLARMAGVRIGIDGDALTLDARAAPPAAVLDLLARHKVQIIALLRPVGGGWSGEDWLALYNAHRTVTRIVQGLSELQASKAALDTCVSLWLDRHPIASPPDQCARCGAGNTATASILPFGTQDTGHAWLHARCWPDWLAARKAEAVAALGLPQP